jgi:hypothetical protein
MSQSKVLAAMLPVIETLERLSIDCYVGGAVASLALGVYRTSADVDIYRGDPARPDADFH